MNVKLYGIAVLGVLLVAHPRLTVAAGGASVGFPVTLVIVAAILGACMLLAVLIARFLLGSRSCPHPHARTAST